MTVRANVTLGLIIILLVMPGIASQADDPQNAAALPTGESYARSIDKWRAERLEEINGEDGWTTLIGLFWLKEGQNKVGSDPSNDIVLPAGPAPKFAGSFHLDNGVVNLEAKPDSQITQNGQTVTSMALASDADGGKPTILKMQSLKLLIIKRGDKLGLRVKDKNNPARSNFQGIHYFPLGQNFRTHARFEPYNPPKIIPIVNVLGMVDNMTSPGALVFEIDGKTYRLDPVLEKGSRQLFIIFGDKTNGKDTYGAGRYLYADPPGSDGTVVVDFNKAHNPSCAFTKYATCPLPPRQNRLERRIEAGEKKYLGPGH